MNIEVNIDCKRKLAFAYPLFLATAEIDTLLTNLSLFKDINARRIPKSKCAGNAYLGQVSISENL